VYAGGGGVLVTQRAGGAGGAGGAGAAGAALGALDLAGCDAVER
jgi:hypothetical protein